MGLDVKPKFVYASTAINTSMYLIFAV